MQMNMVNGPEKGLNGEKTVRTGYVWKTGKTFFLSKREQIVVDAYLESGSFADCAKALRRDGLSRDWQTCKRWLELEHVKQYLMEKLEERGIAAGWTKERWLKVMTDHLMGKARLANGDLYGMKLIGDMLGLRGEGGGVVLNQQINFTQADGKA